MQRYESLGPLGEGSYGAVVKCRHRDSGRLVAIKKFLDSDDDRAVKKIALREIKLLRKLRHDNLVNLLEAWRRRRRWYLVFEFVERTLLDDLEQNPAGLDLDTSRRYLFQVLRAAAFCHQHDIIHRDIKPENVLISLGGVVKLCDFGFARTVASPADGGVYTDYVATRWYRAPELLVGDTKYGKPVDVWAIGCLLMETLTGQPLFPGDSDLDQIHHVVRCFGNLTPRHQELFRRNPVFSGVRLPESSGRVSLQQRFRTMSPAALDLAQSCLAVDPEERAPCSELLERPLFTQDSFHVRFVDELNAKIQKGHRENSTLPKITKTPRQEADDGDERKRRARDKKQAEDMDEKVHKDQSKGKTNTKPCNAAEPLTKRSKPVGNKVPGPSPTAPKNKQVSGGDSSRSTKPPLSDPPDPSEQTHQRTDECRDVRKDVESEVSKTTEERLMETSRSSNPEPNPESGKTRNNLKSFENSRDCLRSPSKPPGSGRRATNRTSERCTRSDSGDPGSPGVVPSNPKLSTTTKPNQSSWSLPKGSAQSSTNPNASRGDRITTRLPDEKHLTQDTGENPARPSSASRAGADDRPQVRGHKEDVRWKVAPRAQSTSPSTLRENTGERPALLKPRSVSDKENHEDPASSASAGTKSKPPVGGPPRDEKSLSRGHFEFVEKPLSLGALKTPRVAGAKAATDVDKDRTPVTSTRGHGSSRRTLLHHNLTTALVHHNLTTADLQEEGLGSAPPPPPSPSPAPLFPPPPTGSSAAGGRLTPAAGFHAGTPGIRCMNKIAGQRGALPTRQNQQFPSGHVGGLVACERSRLSDHRDLRVGGSGVAAAKKHDARSFPGFEKLGGTRAREHRRQTEQKQHNGPAQGQTSGSFQSGTAAARTRPHRDRTANGLANSMLIHFEGHNE